MKRSLVVGVTLAVGIGLLVAPPAAQAKGIDASCSDVESVFARGSGQGMDAGEARRFRTELDTRLKDGVTLHAYELNDDRSAGGYGGHSYDAVDVDKPWNGNAVGAKFSAGYSNDYGRSVDSGVGELFNYLKERQAKCGTARFVLGGYSQGAQVIGQTMVKMSSETPELLTRIDFAAMFGDPKLHLPEGEGIWPPACRGQNLSVWRRTVPDCDTDNGSLGARKPYVPTVVTERSGLWCNDDDFVCGSDPRFWMTSGHGQYAQAGGAIDDAAREIAIRLSRTLPPGKAEQVDTQVIVIGAGTTGLDVAFVIDTTGSMGGYIDQVKAFTRTAAGSIRDLRGRVALVAYKDAGDEYTAKVFSGFQGDFTAFEAQLDALAASGGGDTPEALLHGLMTTLNGLDWRPGATKAAVVLTDAGFHEPDLVDGSTVDQVAARALQIDPVNVYPVIPSYLTAEYQRLADVTTGQVIPNEGDVAAAMTTALTRLRNRPVPLLAMTGYVGRPNDTFTFDASASYVIASTITTYAWDFDGDGVTDQTTSEPVVNHTYTAAFDGVMQVRLTAADGGVASGSATVKVSPTAPPTGRPATPKDLKIEPLTGNTARLSWTPGDDTAATWGVSVDGVPVGQAAKTTTTVELIDLDRTKDLTLGVTPLTSDKLTGSTATVVLAKGAGTIPVNACEGKVPTPAKSGVYQGRQAIIGTSGNDIIVGTPGNDVILGYQGDDIICGLGGDDIIVGSQGADTLDGGDGRDTLSGDVGVDTLLGGAGDDLLAGANGNDIVDGGAGADVMTGDNGNDIMRGGAGNDTINGGAGDDTVDGGADVDRCVGGTGRNAIAACEASTGR
ncbi:cutinase family protein [Virgisporangium aurantiacum]|uniref:Uncharacterized protein n=1 Tax=Virgisporangium aurantiacum TaxID=175570 RepID=A0A8J3ZA16_9ACTN|nr:cutinase family protein [Virgisporangium aurantiacum]GIJ57710.1 hypothetical protein Vau01_052260 [Virgisporangium aurantiacum]